MNVCTIYIVLSFLINYYYCLFIVLCINIGNYTTRTHTHIIKQFLVGWGFILNHLFFFLLDVVSAESHNNSSDGSVRWRLRLRRLFRDRRILSRHSRLLFERSGGENSQLAIWIIVRYHANHCHVSRFDLRVGYKPGVSAIRITGGSG